MVDVGVRSNFVAAWHAAKIMIPQRSGLMVAVSGYTGVTYTYGVVFGMCKTAVDRMARDMAIEFQPHHVASLSLWQGLTFTERAQRNLARNPAMQELTVTMPAVGPLRRNSCGPGDRGTGGDPDVMARSGGHLHHRRGGAGLRDHRHRWTGYPVAAGRARLADLGTDRGGPPPMDAERLGWLLDRQDILDCLTRFSRGMDRFDRVVLSAFHPDAVIAAGDFVGGPGELYDWASAMHEQGQVAHASQSAQQQPRNQRRHRAQRNLLLVCRTQLRRDQLDGWRTLHRSAGTGRWSLANRFAYQCHRVCPVWCPPCRSHSRMCQTSTAMARRHAAKVIRHISGRSSTDGPGGNPPTAAYHIKRR